MGNLCSLFVNPNTPNSPLPHTYKSLSSLKAIAKSLPEEIYSILIFLKALIGLG